MKSIFGESYLQVLWEAVEVGGDEATFSSKSGVAKPLLICSGEPGCAPDLDSGLIGPALGIVWAAGLNGLGCCHRGLVSLRAGSKVV